MAWEAYRAWLRTAWFNLLQTHPDEPTMQDFLERHPSLLPGAGGEVGPGGHHGPVLSAVIRQPLLQGLGPRRLPDFMWVRRDTAAVRPICIEIEDPKKPWFNAGDMTPTAKLTQALDQLIEWKVWFSLPENQQVFLKVYAPGFSDRTLEPEFVLIYGRDSEFRVESSHHDTPQHVRRKRDHMRRSKEHFYTYDMLVPQKEAEGYGTVAHDERGWRLRTLPPTFTTGAFVMDLCGAVANPSEAIECMELTDPARKAYIAKRWSYWRSLQLGEQNHLLPGGRE